MPLKQVEGLLRAKIGLDLDSIGISALVAAVRDRMLACELHDARGYFALLRSAPDELDQLVEEMVVRETWFFRGRSAFEVVTRRCGLNSAERGQPYRVLSIPCASGEEPYSIAMSLLEAGIPPAGFEVHAVDVSSQALAAARRGVYGKNSFRGPFSPAGQFFEATPAGMRVADRVRAQVRFSQGNVLDSGLYAGTQFEAVFCRNLLIYLDTASRLVALRNLERWLRPDGALFAGHSESLQVTAFGFRKLGETRSFAFTRRRLDSERPEKAGVRFARVRRLRSVRPRAELAARERPASGVESAPVRRALAPLDEARELADRGQLAAARACCERAIATSPTGDAFSLLGIIMSAAGNVGGALDAFNKALYLDANHYQSLCHLALLLEQAGDLAAAAKLRSRARRSNERAARKEHA
jgi:chemotaxis protein methyltransferase WspC